MATVTLPPQTETPDRFLLENIRWQTYLMLLKDLENHPVRLTYDHGRLEIMAPAYRHESFAFLLGQLIAVLAEELQISCIAAGSTTFKREDLARGLEPDHCFYFKNYPLIVGKSELDLSVDPPPDLSIEVDITRSVLNRMSMYASLGVPEIWRCRESGLEVYLLKESGEIPTKPRKHYFSWGVHERNGRVHLPTPCHGLVGVFALRPGLGQKESPS